MSQPQIVQSALGGETVVARLGLGGEDELYATPTRTLVYRADGLLSDESVEEYPHDAERVTVSEGRRKAKVTLDYGLDGSETFALPAKHLDRALHPLVEGVLKANDILDDEESMERLFRFSELTLVVAGTRVVRHIGSSLWDEDYEEYRYEDVTDLTFENGSVATSVVLTVGGRQERFKTPNEDARAVREALESTLLGYWDVSSLDELRAANEPEDEEPADTKDVSFGDGPDPLSANPAELSDEPKNATRTEDPETDASAGRRTEVRADETQTAQSDNAETERTATSQTAATDATGQDRVVQQMESGDVDEQRSSAHQTQSGDVSEGTSASSRASPDDVDETQSVSSANRNAPRSGDVAEQSSASSRTPSDDIAEQSSAGRQTASGDVDGTQTAESDASFEDSGFESAGPVADGALADEVAALRETVEAQGEEIRHQRELIEQLIEELRRGR